MSAGRSIVAAGIVGVVLWALKREAEYHKTQEGGSVDLASLNAATRRLNGSFFDSLTGLLEGVGSGDGSTKRGTGILSSLKQKAAPVPAKSPQPRRGSEPSNIGAQLMSDLMRDFGLSKNQAAGVVGNLDHESAGFKSLQEIKPLVPGSRGGWGYAQWTGPRRRQFEAWVKSRGLDARSYAANYGFLKHELTNTEEKRVLPRLRRTSTVEEAAKVFSGSSKKGESFDGFLRPGIPHMSSRIQRARRYA